MRQRPGGAPVPDSGITDPPTLGKAHARSGWRVSATWANVQDGVSFLTPCLAAFGCRVGQFHVDRNRGARAGRRQGQGQLAGSGTETDCRLVDMPGDLFDGGLLVGLSFVDGDVARGIGPGLLAPTAAPALAAALVGGPTG